MIQAEPALRDPVTIVLLGRPVPSNPARRGANGFRFVPKKQTDAVAAIRLAAQDAMNGQPMFEGPVAIEFRAEIPVPKSFSKRKHYDAVLGLVWPTKKPDLKNLAALAEDAMKTVVYSDDNRVCRHSSVKVFGLQPKVVITVSSLPGEAA